MQYRESVKSGVRQPDVEHNSGDVYVRFDFVRSTETVGEETRDVWTYNEYYMTEDEYNDIRVGRFNGTWSDALRSVQRGYLYDIADARIMKYTTDAEDADKKALWIAFKAGVRASQTQEGYPEAVEYPDLPE